MDDSRYLFGFVSVSEDDSRDPVQPSNSRLKYEGRLALAQAVAMHSRL